MKHVFVNETREQSRTNSTCVNRNMSIAELYFEFYTLDIGPFIDTSQEI